MNFVPCVSWVRRGVAKSLPEKVELSRDELAEIIKHTRSELVDMEDEEEEGDAPMKSEEASSSSSGGQQRKCEKETDIETKYGLDRYDDEDEEEEEGGKGKGRLEDLLCLGNLAMFASNEDDPLVTLNEDEEDSEKGDYEVLPSDNLLLMGHIEGESATLEVFIYNEEESHFYCHHDILLPAFPLCIECLSYDPAEGTAGNLAAVGSMSPVIEVWDLDVVDSLEPDFKLGKKAKKRKKQPGYGHSDAVLALAWNRISRNVLASGSADNTILLWDLKQGTVLSSPLPLQDKVQSLSWHRFEAQTLLAGGCDKSARILDCRTSDSSKSWHLGGEVEVVLWDHFQPFCFLASTDNGMVHYIDARQDKPLWNLKAHDKEVTGLSLSSQCPGLLCTSSMDSHLKVWDIAEGKPEFVLEKDLKVGSLLCLSACPDAPFVICAGGDSRSDNFKVWDVRESAAVLSRFGERPLLEPVCQSQEVKSEESKSDAAEARGEGEEMDVDMSSLSLKGKKGKKKKKKKSSSEEQNSLE